MKRLITPDGRINFGIIDDPVEDVNYLDYHLESPLGKVKSKLWKRFRFNQFVFLGITGPDFICGLAVVDLKFLSNGFFYVFDRKNSQIDEIKQVSHGRAAIIDRCPSPMNAVFSSRKLNMSFKNDNISAVHQGMRLDARLDLAHVNPLRICTRAGYRGWVYTEKTSPIPISGTLTWNGQTRELSSPGTMALLDWSAGFMRRETCWNWAAISTVLPDSRSLGLNLSCGVNETGFTENAFWLDGKRIKVDTVNFMFNPNDLMAPWKIHSFDGKVDLDFTPENKRGENINIQLVASRFTQLMGTFSGTLVTDSGEHITLNHIPGFSEDHYAKF